MPLTTSPGPGGPGPGFGNTVGRRGRHGILLHLPVPHTQKLRCGALGRRPWGGSGAVREKHENQDIWVSLTTGLGLLDRLRGWSPAPSQPGTADSRTLAHTVGNF